jgi:hypothetical protein
MKKKEKSEVPEKLNIATTAQECRESNRNFVILFNVFRESWTISFFEVEVHSKLALT